MRNGPKTLLLLVAGLILQAGVTAQAAPVSYGIVLRVGGVLLPPAPPEGCGPDPRRHLFGCDWKAGDLIIGGFELFDDTSGLADGIYSDIPLKAWHIQIGEVLWDINVASDFVGFRDGKGDGKVCGAGGSGFGAINPGLIITAGLVTGFCGGAYGVVDMPFIDFDYTSGPGGFGALDQGPTELRGTYFVGRVVPEPGSLALLGMGLAGLGFARRRKVS